jgi:hypothetical protein
LKQLGKNEVGSFSKLEDALFETLRVLTKHRRVLLVGAQVPASCDIDGARLLQGPLRHALPSPPCPPLPTVRAERAGAIVNAMLARVQARLDGRVDVIYPVDYLCHDGCPVFDNGHWLYWDATHFTVAGSLRAAYLAGDTLKKFMLNGLNAGAPSNLFGN